MYNLTNSQKDLLKQLVQKIRDGYITEEFLVYETQAKLILSGQKAVEDNKHELEITTLMKKALEENNLLQCVGRGCSLTGKAYEAVDNNFSEPDTSFVKHLTPLADITNLDKELKERCLPILGAGSADPKGWDNAVNSACRVLENRLRDIGGISDPKCVGVSLARKVFNERNEILTSKFSDTSLRDRYGDLYAGVIGVFRNLYAHHHVDPTPEEGGAIIVFIDLLLKKIEDLR